LSFSLTPGSKFQGSKVKTNHFKEILVKLEKFRAIDHQNPFSRLRGDSAEPIATSSLCVADEQESGAGTRK